MHLASVSYWTINSQSSKHPTELYPVFRLESGPSEPTVGLSSALVKLHQLIQLELIAFPLHPTLHDAITQLPKLNLLNLAPAALNNEQLAG